MNKNKKNSQFLESLYSIIELVINLNQIDLHS
jgi:hypothetical protein